MQIFSLSGQIFGKKGQNQIFSCLPWCFLGILGDNKVQKPNIFLKRGCKVGAGCGSACLPFGVSTGCMWCMLRGASGVLRCVFRPFVPAFCLLCCIPFPALPFKYALFRILRRFSEGFGAFVWVCVAWALCVACVAFVRVNS